MKRIAGVLVVVLVCCAPVLGQERDRSLARISMALEQPLPRIRGADPASIGFPKTLGVFTMVQPSLRGEMVRVSVPVGHLVSHALNGIAAANQRRQEAAARRRVAAALAWFEERKRSRTAADQFRY